MKQLSFKKLSVLGLVLMAASAVAAAFTPAKATDDNKFDNCNGHIVVSTAPDSQIPADDKTCTVAVDSANCWTETGDAETSTASGDADETTVANETRLSHGVLDCVTIVA